MVSPFALGIGTPVGLAFDSSGNLDIASGNLNSLIRIAPDGTRSTVAVGFINPYRVAIQLPEPASMGLPLVGSIMLLGRLRGSIIPTSLTR